MRGESGFEDGAYARAAFDQEIEEDGGGIEEFGEGEGMGVPIEDGGAEERACRDGRSLTNALHELAGE